MSVPEILEQIKALSRKERIELIKAIIDLLDEPVQTFQAKTEAISGSTELVDPDIEDPVNRV